MWTLNSKGAVKSAQFLRKFILLLWDRQTNRHQTDALCFSLWSQPAFLSMEFVVGRQNSQRIKSYSSNLRACGRQWKTWRLNFSMFCYVWKLNYHVGTLHCHCHKLIKKSKICSFSIPFYIGLLNTSFVAILSLAAYSESGLLDT